MEESAKIGERRENHSGSRRRSSKVTVTGKKEVTKVKLDPEAVVIANEMWR